MEDYNYRKKIVDYLKKNLKKGYTIESLKWALIGQGYSRTSVERAVEELNKELARKAPILKEEPVIKYEILDEKDRPIKIKKSFWKRIFGL
jgi:actin-like ATPase involved in cell morphogenesis